MLIDSRVEGWYLIHFLDFVLVLYRSFACDFLWDRQEVAT